MKILSTERLLLRWMSDEDTDFVIRLLNEKSFIDNIGDRQVRTHEDALKYIKKLRDNYLLHGFGFFVVESLTGEKMGISGMTRRDTLEHPDIGFAFLPEYCGKGFAYESALAVKNKAVTDWGIRKIVAIVSRNNQSSRKVLAKIDMVYQGLIRLTPDDAEIEYYAWEKN